jgi:hypothetical protein
MSWPANESATPSAGAGDLFGASANPASGSNSSQRNRGRLPIRLVVGVLSAILLVGSALHIEPAIKAGMHDGTRGSWVATSSQCGKRTGCVWHGKFVTSTGHVLVSDVGYAGSIPGDIHPGTSVPALYPGGSGLVFPASGSNLWISLLVGIVLGLLGLFWASHRWVAELIRERRAPVLLARLPRN